MSSPVTPSAPAAPAAPPRGRPRDPDLDRRILETTLTLLVEDGVARLSMEGVAARSGFAKSTIYRRWSSKSALIIAAMQSLPELAPRTSGGTRADLCALLEDLGRILRDSPLGSVLPHLAAERGVDPDLDEQVSQYFEARLTPILDVVSRGMSNGDLPADRPPEVIANLLYGPIVTRIVFLDQPADTEFIELAVDAVLSLHGPAR